MQEIKTKCKRGGTIKCTDNIDTLAETTLEIFKNYKINRPQENRVITKQLSTINTQVPYIK